MTKVLIADDHEVVRAGLRQIIGEADGMVIVGEAVDAQETLDKASTTDCDVVLLDITMPGADGLSVLEELKGLYPDLPVLILSVHSEDVYGVYAIKANAAVSSQAACANLFLPILQYPEAAAQILRSVKPDLKSIATDYFDSGFRIEFWDEGYNNLKDHNQVTVTDSDIAIAYRDREGHLNLWLIEHKLTEKEFTTCGGSRSDRRKQGIHNCGSISDILQNRSLCYYHSGRGYEYWNITTEHSDVFPVDRLLGYGTCPFKGGMNQLWRNQLLGLAVQKSKAADLPFERVFFSVVYHPKNDALIPTLKEYTHLIDGNDRFSYFTSDHIVDASEGIDIPAIRRWRDWYSDLYYF